MKKRNYKLESFYRQDPSGAAKSSLNVVQSFQVWRGIRAKPVNLGYIFNLIKLARKCVVKTRVLPSWHEVRVAPVIETVIASVIETIIAPVTETRDLMVSRLRNISANIGMVHFCRKEQYKNRS